MGYINEHWASADMTVSGVIVALEDDQRARYTSPANPHTTSPANPYTTSPAYIPTPPRPYLFVSNLTPANVLANPSPNVFLLILRELTYSAVIPASAGAGTSVSVLSNIFSTPRPLTLSVSA
jgi:hypothetical protein